MPGPSHHHKSAIKAIACTVCEKLNDAKLKRLGEHKYSSSGSTLLDPIMQKFWNWFVAHCIPRWWAPNAMTLVGLVFNIFTCSLLIYFSPDARQEISAWVLVLAAIGLFVYQTLDACDGKQARRTGNSSSLGELFDHGCDVVSTVFVSLSVCLSVQLGSLTTWMVVLCAGATSLFYTAHWQTYVSGTLKFGKFDVTEAQFTIITIHLVSAVFGTSFWNTIVFGVQLKVIPLMFTVLNECFIFSCVLKSILGGGCGKNGSTVAGTSILSPIIPILLVFSFTLIIYSKSTTVFVDHVALYLVAFGFVSAKITNKLVVAHMSKSEMTKMDTIFIGPLMLFFNQYFNFYFDEYLMLWLAFAYILIDFSYFSYSICRQLADFLNINVLKINDPSEGSSGGVVVVPRRTLESAASAKTVGPPAV
ncbi:hypothetical protein TYRP_006879 [Tyrophagus putrescentiae]|nr:hypothetical protein TYRP_006879 [Tyrophagus putrescentiae]